MKKTLLVFLLLISSVLLNAHEFWLSPDKYFYTIRDIALIRFRVGENFTGENWTGNKEKIKQLSHYLPNGTQVDIADRLSIQKGDSIRLPLQTEGTHMVIFNSTNSHIELDSDKFNDYLKEDGLQTAIDFRQKNNETTKPGKEYYQRSVKTIIQVGDLKTDACTKPTGLPLDIIPFENPYASPAMAPADKLPTVTFRVLFKGKPLANLLVKTWNREKNGTGRMEEYRTNNRGTVKVKRYSGPFMVSAVYMERLNGDEKAEWQSYWASLHFEYSSFFSAVR
ncbi:DUF4198 domain-containing protein [Sediminibacterium goheungense]|uniref:Putative GH25 family protein n=1 Tax=Sediminibacterium goheungense TaxID=1086393 RepID=A0A4R6IXT9_9BACT|nr:DUF4198 domain-containing protein [Sediminibacterium goheungense]TDO27231.1 putative GH25 family protein [Sediminibacterium goheungense]